MKEKTRWIAKMMIIVMLLCSTTTGIAFADKAEQNKTTETSDGGGKAATPTEAEPEEPTKSEESEKSKKPEKPAESDEDEADEVLDGVMLTRSIMNVEKASSSEAAFIPAKNPHWAVGDNAWDGIDYPGWGDWDQLSDEEAEDVLYTRVMVYNNGVPVTEGFTSSSGYYEEWDARMSFSEPGEYTFRAAFVKDGWDVPEEYWSEYSEPYNYEIPDKKVSTPINLKWISGGVMTWDDVPEKDDILGASYKLYIIYLWELNPATGEYEKSRVMTSVENEADLSYEMEDGKTYKFNVRALGDLIDYENSDFSALSDPFVMDDTVNEGKRLIDDLKDGDIKANIENTNLESEEKDTLKLAIQVDEEAAQSYADLETEYKSAAQKADLSVEAGESGVDTEKVEVVGGILNGATGIKFEKTEEKDLTNANASKYKIKRAINISLTDKSNTLPGGELKYPVLITMPVPDGISPNLLTIVHIKHNGEAETINPRVNSDGTVSFAVTEFSTFVFVDKTSSGGTSSGGTSSGGGGGDRGSSSSSTSGTITIDSKKGRVNSLTGIITGTSDSNSKWISETSVNAAGETDVRWKLQYADGTYAAGLNVADAQGNVTEQPLWEMINGAWYAFGADGYAKSGLTFDPVLNGWFYIDINKGMLTGWQQINGNWYYFNTVSDGTKGIMFVNRQTPDGYYVNTNGLRDEKDK
ncbi:hypothetical protein [Clostridium transplantifaecale]|uniref:hypothetical protein n=1 Tax=Clostridium transplantifaecale TaxID=2479838 RepID=UPI001FAA12AF|nr:hypothetical protein [Clostridium transplantifaecale]